MNSDELDIEFQAGYDAYISRISYNATGKSCMWRFAWLVAQTDDKLGLLCSTTLSIFA